MSEFNRVTWVAENILGMRPACSAVISVSDNGRHKTHKEYKLIFNYADENNENGSFEIDVFKWQSLIKKLLEENV